MFIRHFVLSASVLQCYFSNRTSMAKNTNCWFSFHLKLMKNIFVGNMLSLKSIFPFEFYQSV